MPKYNTLLKIGLVHLVIFALMSASPGWAAGNKKFLSIKKAKVFATRAIVESVIGLKVRSNALWTKDAANDNYIIESEVASSIKGVAYDAPKYDKAKDIAMITARIRLGSITNIIDKPIHYNDVIISRIGFATSSKEFAGQLAALRAAELNAYDEMAQMIVGQEIRSETKVRNFVLESDEVRTKTQAALWGSEVIDYGWEEDGTAFIKLRLNAKWVKNLVGEQVQYPQDYLEVVGYGATHDDLKDDIQ